MLSNRVRTTSVALAVVAGVVGSGALTAAAQDTTATPVAPTTSDSTTAQSQSTQPQGPNRGFGRGMMFGLDLGADGNLADSPIITAIAGALKLDAATLVTDLQSGKSVTDLATAQNVDIQTVYDAVTAKYKQLLDAEVTTGYLTQAQADTRLKTFTDNVAKFPLFANVQFPNPANTQGQGFPGGRGQGGFPGGRGNGGQQGQGGFGPSNGGPGNGGQQGQGGFGPGNGNGPQGGFGPGMNGNNGSGPWGGHRGGQWGNQQNGQPNAPTDPNAPANPTTPQTSPATPEATQTASA